MSHHYEFLLQLYHTHTATTSVVISLFVYHENVLMKRILRIQLHTYSYTSYTIFIIRQKRTSICLFWKEKNRKKKFYFKENKDRQLKKSRYSQLFFNSFLLIKCWIYFFLCFCRSIIYCMLSKLLVHELFWFFFFLI